MEKGKKKKAPVPVVVDEEQKKLKERILFENYFEEDDFYLPLQTPPGQGDFHHEHYGFG